MHLPIIFSLLYVFCSNPEQKMTKIQSSLPAEKIKKDLNFSRYWYAGKAEITSYKLSQVRYGEIHEGIAVNIFVTEDFLPDKQVKADYRDKKNIPILKLNSTKKYVTGIYPYSLMTSTFSPVDINQRALKVSFSAQEWCGNTFVQLNNKLNFNINFFSYFESNTDKKINLQKNILENELWTQLRISPKNLPVGKLQIIPSFEYLGLNHKKFRAYEATASLEEKHGFILYSIKYPKLNRTLTLKATKKFPHTIEYWEEKTFSRGKNLTTKGKKIKTIQSAYWNKNSLANIDERKKLGLD